MHPAATGPARRTTTVAGALAAAFLLAACGGPEEKQAPPPPDVVVETPVQRDVTAYYRYSGTTASPEAVDIRARVPGYLEEQHFKASTDVEVGTKLFTIEPGPYRIAVEAAKAAVAEAEANLGLANVESERVAEAFAAGAATEQEKLEREATVKAQESLLAAARASVEDAELKLSYTDVTSPIAGRVGRRQADLGNLVGQTEPTVLTRVVQLDPMHVYFDVSERIVLEYLERGRNGNYTNDEGPDVEVSRANDGPDFPFVGKLDFVDTEVDSGTGTIRVRGVLPNAEEKLFPGLFVRIRVPYDTLADAVLVRRDAISRSLAGDFVTVVNAEGLAEQRIVTLGPEEADLVVVTAGLDGSERYVTRGLQKAKPGDAVNAMTAEEMDRKLADAAKSPEGVETSEQGEKA